MVGRVPAMFFLRLEDGLVHFFDSFNDLALRMVAVSTPIARIDAHCLDKNYFALHTSHSRFRSS